jgi:hypothetical protein
MGTTIPIKIGQKKRRKKSCCFREAKENDQIRSLLE